MGNETSYKVQMLRDGTPSAVTAEGREIPAGELTVGMEKWNSGLASWDPMESVKGPDRWGKMTLGTYWGDCRISATYIVRVR